MDENLAAQAELALELQGNYDSLFYEGQWHTNGQLAKRAAWRSASMEYSLLRARKGRSSA